jgi:hypothetical protein
LAIGDNFISAPMLIFVCSIPLSESFSSPSVCFSLSLILILLPNI